MFNRTMSLIGSYNLFMYPYPYNCIYALNDFYHRRRHLATLHPPSRVEARRKTYGAMFEWAKWNSGLQEHLFDHLSPEEAGWRPKGPW